MIREEVNKDEDREQYELDVMEEMEEIAERRQEDYDKAFENYKNEKLQYEIQAKKRVNQILFNKFTLNKAINTNLINKQQKEARARERQREKKRLKRQAKRKKEDQEEEEALSEDDEVRFLNEIRFTSQITSQIY